MEKDEVHFMDFGEIVDCGPRMMALTRPLLSRDDQILYEDQHRCGNVLNEMHRFYQDARLCDISLMVSEEKLHCHRLVLAASSLYFERMFSNDMSEKHAAEVTINDVTSCALKHLIEFAYSSKITVAKDTVLEIFEAADMLQFPAVRLFCEEFLIEQVDEKNCISFLVYADAFSCERLYEKAKLSAALFFKLICDTTEFLELPFQHLLPLLKEDSIEMEYEEHIYNSLKEWVLHDMKKRFPHLPELFKCIRLNFVSRWFLIEVISKDSIIMESLECNKIVQYVKDQLLAQGHTYDIPWQLPPSRKCTGMTEKIVFVNTYDPNPRESEVMLFDPVNKSWSNINKPCPLASEYSTCEAMGDVMLVIGGWNVKAGTKSLNQRGAVNTVHEFRVMRSIFPSLWYVGAHPMGITRYLHSTITVSDHLYLIGGMDETQSLQASVFRTNVEKNYRFEVCPRMLYPVCRPALVHWENRIFSFGGFGDGGVPRQFVQCFEIRTNKWSEIKPGLEGVYLSCQYAVCIENMFYILCGDMKSPTGNEDTMVGHRVAQRCVDRVYTFSPVTHQWTKIFSFLHPKTGSFCVTTLGKKIYITGGDANSSRYYAVDCYDIEQNTLETVGNTREDSGNLSLCTTMWVMHENFGL